MKLQTDMIMEIIKLGGLAWKEESVPGLPDIHCIYRGFIFYIEVKKGKDRLSEIQKQRMIQLLEHNVPVLILTDKNFSEVLNNVKKLIKSWDSLQDPE